MTTNRSSDRAVDSARHPDPRTLDCHKRQAEAAYTEVQARGTTRELAIYEFAIMEQLCAANNSAPYEV